VERMKKEAKGWNVLKSGDNAVSTGSTCSVSF
jgi:hypothetical protein